MSGKILGTLIGLCLGLALDSGGGAAVLAGLGFVLGHWVDVRNAERIELPLDAPPSPPGIPSIEEAASSMQVRDVCTLLIEIARADTAVSRVEIREIRRWLEGTFPGHLRGIPAFLKAALAAPNERVEILCERLRDLDQGPANPELLNALYSVAEVDGPVNAEERAALREAAQALGLSPRREPEDPPEPAWDPAADLKTLGLPPEATDEEITSAYRRLAREHHPDRFSHLGGPALEAASARFRAVHDAYEALKRGRGF